MGLSEATHLVWGWGRGWAQLTDPGIASGSQACQCVHGWQGVGSLARGHAQHASETAAECCAVLLQDSTWEILH